jgi:hypothetical protein
MEEWRQIADFPYYEVSNQGRVRRGDRILSQSLAGKVRQYYQITLSIPKRVHKYTHRLVAEAFVPNPDNLPDIDHIDRNRENNVVSNLKWSSKSDNMLNRGHWGKLGERNIYYRPERQFPYNVIIQRNNKFIINTPFKTLDEAKAYRDGLLTQL